MPKADLLRRIDQLPATRSGESSIVTSGGSGGSTSQGTIYVGRLEGPRAGLRRMSNGNIMVEAVDTANVPFFSAGARDYATNSKWLNVGYAGAYGIRMAAHTSAEGDPEEHPNMEIDGEALIGTIAISTSTNAAAPNGSVYYSSDASKIVYKDGGGTVHNLY